jgi:hypothetical protein
VVDLFYVSLIILVVCFCFDVKSVTRNGRRSASATTTNRSGVAGPQRGSLHEASGPAAERRGLLDDDEGEDMIEFETRKKSN